MVWMNPVYKLDPWGIHKVCTECNLALSNHSLFLLIRPTRLITELSRESSIARWEFSYELLPGCVCYTFVIPCVCLHVGHKGLLYIPGCSRNSQHLPLLPDSCKWQVCTPSMCNHFEKGQTIKEINISLV